VRAEHSIWPQDAGFQPALKLETLVLSCMAYVDLNLIRAKMTVTPETSEHTRIQQRPEAIQQHKRKSHKLQHFAGNPRQDMPQDIAV
jgi:hypothetical protein